MKEPWKNQLIYFEVCTVWANFAGKMQNGFAYLNLIERIRSAHSA